MSSIAEAEELMIRCYRDAGESLTDVDKSRIRSAFRAGYISAVRDYGIWKDGVQRIGCIERPVKEIVDEVLHAGRKGRES